MLSTVLSRVLASAVTGGVVDKIRGMADQSRTLVLGLARAEQKSRSRSADARALVSGRKSPTNLQRENEVFGRIARSARVDLAASRSLG
jgi:hypothetical protein